MKKRTKKSHPSTSAPPEIPEEIANIMECTSNITSKHDGAEDILVNAKAKTTKQGEASHQNSLTLSCLSEEPEREEKIQEILQVLREIEPAPMCVEVTREISFLRNGKKYVISLEEVEIPADIFVLLEYGDYNLQFHKRKNIYLHIHIRDTAVLKIVFVFIDFILENLGQNLIQKLSDGISQANTTIKKFQEHFSQQAELYKKKHEEVLAISEHFSTLKKNLVFSKETDKISFSLLCKEYFRQMSTQTPTPASVAAALSLQELDILAIFPKVRKQAVFDYLSLEISNETFEKLKTFFGTHNRYPTRTELVGDFFKISHLKRMAKATNTTSIASEIAKYCAACE